jgi:hypothetical protein
VVQEGGRRCKKSTLNDLVYLTPLRIPLMNPPIEGNDKCRHLKKWTCKWSFAAGVYLSKAQNPIPPPLTHVIRVCSILLLTGKGGEMVRRAAVYKAGSKLQRY